MATSLNGALDNAWRQIQDYCKAYAGASTRDVQVRWKHDVYGWIEFGVTPEGTAYFVHGDHSNSSHSDRADWYFHPEHKNTAFLKYERLEEIVRDWPAIKEHLATAFSVERSIFNFKV